jgi:hypothetical protein
MDGRASFRVASGGGTLGTLGPGSGLFIIISSSSKSLTCNNPLIRVFNASASSPLPCHVGGTVSASLNTPRGLPETSRRFFTRLFGSEAGS